MLKAENAVLVIIDIQEKLARIMNDLERTVKNMQTLIRGIQVFNIPIVVTEQYPHGLGPTIPEIAELLPEIKPIPKVHFSCCDNEDFTRALKATGRKQVLLSGIECHVCVYQTAIDLLKANYEVYAVSDTITTRIPENKPIGLNLMSSSGAVITSSETVLFELLKIAKGEQFKAISQIVR
jgi:nicotinamidase-related amidase